MAMSDLIDKAIEMGNLSVLIRKIKEIDGVKVLLAPILVNEGEYRVEMWIEYNKLHYHILVTNKERWCSLLDAYDLYDKYPVHTDELGLLLAIAENAGKTAKLVVCGNKVGILVWNKFTVIVTRHPLNMPWIQLKLAEKAYALAE